MPDVLVRDLSDRALELLKDQARSRGRSLQDELKHVLEQAAQAADVAAALATADQIRHELIMTRKQRKAQESAVEMTSERIDREDAIEAL